MADEDDELIQQAIEVIRQTRRASTSAIQRRLRIGYTRAARVMDVLEERGMVCLFYTSPSPPDRTRYRMPRSSLKKKKNTQRADATCGVTK